MVYAMMDFPWTATKFLWFTYFMFYAFLFSHVVEQSVLSWLQVIMVALLYHHLFMYLGIYSQDPSSPFQRSHHGGPNTIGAHESYRCFKVLSLHMRVGYEQYHLCQTPMG